jgi:tRNA A37 threonylcarbamoyladenosine modification protein TsaB
MILYINTVSQDEIFLALEIKPGLRIKRRIKAARRQAEKLLPAIDQLLQSNKIKSRQITKIVVANQGGSFTSLRIGVITANALAYAWHIPVEPETILGDNKHFAVYSLVEPHYDREPEIGQAKPVH